MKTHRDVCFSPDLSAEQLEEWLTAKTLSNEDERWLFLFAAQKRRMDELDSVLKRHAGKIVGGRFPGLVHKGAHYAEGMLLIRLDEVCDVSYVPLDEGVGEIFRSISAIRSTECTSGLVFFDPFTDYKLALVDQLYNQFGSDFGCIGGGAGTAELQKAPCIVTPSGLSDNYATVILRRKKLNVGIAHGWEAISEPLKVTKADGTRISSLNYEPALERYKEVIQSHASDEWASRSFEEWARSYPLGKLRLGAEYIVRDPYAYDANDLLLVDEVETGEFVVVLNGNTERLIDGAKRARNMLNQASDVKVQDHLFTVDCISRIIYLEDDFGRELRALAGKNMLNGALTIGEVVNDGMGPLDIYNKTVALTKL